MKLVLVARDNLDLEGYQAAGKIIESQRPEITVVTVCGERNPSLWKDAKNNINIFSEFDEFQNANQAASDEELSARLVNSTLPITLFQGTPHYVYEEQSAKKLVLEQLYLEEQISKLFNEIRPSFVFSGAAGHLIWTVSLLVARTLSIPSYRVLGLSYLNPGNKGVRYWFARNLESRFSDDPQDLMGWPTNAVSAHVEILLQGIKDNTYRLDHVAKTQYRARFISQGWKAIGLDVHRWIRGGDRRAQWRLKAVLNDYLNQSLATPVDELKKPFILYPLNMPRDEQITLRAPHLRDLFSSIEQMANVLPYGYTLVIKEHPVFPGMLDYGRLKRILKRRPNVKFVFNSTDIHSLLDNASILISVNSTAALDALVRGIPVITLGECFYKGTGLTYDVEYMYELSDAFKLALLDHKAANRHEMLVSVLSRFLQETYPGADVIEVSDPHERYNLLAQGLMHKISIYTGQSVKLEKELT